MFEKTKLFGQILLDKNLVTELQLTEALNKKATTMSHRKIGEIFVRLGYLSWSHVALVVAEQLGLELAEIDAFRNISAEVIAKIEWSIATLFHIVPIRQDGDFFVVTSADPEFIADRTIEFFPDEKIVWVVASHSDISMALAKYYPTIPDRSGDVLGVRDSKLPEEPLSRLADPSIELTLEERIADLEQRVSQLEALSGGFFEPTEF